MKMVTTTEFIYICVSTTCQHQCFKNVIKGYNGCIRGYSTPINSLERRLHRSNSIYRLSTTGPFVGQRPSAHSCVFVKARRSNCDGANCNKEEVGEANIVSMDAGKPTTLSNGTEWNGMERNGMEQNGSNCCTIQTWMLDGQIICVNHIEQFVFGP